MNISYGVVMMTSASTSSLSNVEFSPSLSEVVTSVCPWSSSHFRMPSSFSVVPRRAGCCLACSWPWRESAFQPATRRARARDVRHRGRGGLCPDVRHLLSVCVWQLLRSETREQHGEQDAGKQREMTQGAIKNAQQHG
jgi:hypothetical protein